MIDKIKGTVELGFDSDTVGKTSIINTPSIMDAFMVGVNIGELLGYNKKRGLVFSTRTYLDYTNYKDTPKLNFEIETIDIKNGEFPDNYEEPEDGVLDLGEWSWRYKLDD